MKDLTNSVRAAIDQKHAQKALSLLKPALDKDPSATLDSLREDGTLRFARYSFEAETLTTVVEWLRRHPSTKSHEPGAKYLDSVLALGSIAPAVRTKFKRLQPDITPFFLKRYIVTVEHLFRKFHQRQPDFRWSSWKNCSLEELADGFSYYFSLLQEKQPVTVTHLNHLPLPQSGLTHMLDNLAEFARIIRFREAELLTASFPYVARYDNQAVTIAAENPDLEKSIRWGYIRDQSQRHADRLQAGEDQMHSLKDLAAAFIERLGDRLCSIVGGNQPRVRLEIPLAMEFAKAFVGNHVFREEVALVNDTLKALFLSPNEIHLTKIHKSITLQHLLKFRRLCTFTSFAQDEFCRRKNLLNTPTHVRSMVTHFSVEEAHTLARMFCGTEHPEDLFEVLCNPSGPGSVFDLQRTPVIKAAGQYLVPSAVVANSNITHNALQATRFRFDDSSSVDPVADSLLAAFKEVGVPALPRVHYSFSGSSGEVDVLAFFENKLFAFECKNSLTPCSTHELRQSYGYIVKGFEQLSKFRKLLALSEFITWLRKKTGFALPREPAVTTCVAMGNRMFHGYRGEGHCVRNIHELVNAITGGVARFMFPVSAEDPFGAKIHLQMGFWQGQHISAADLTEFLGDHPLHKLALESMVEHDETIEFGNKYLHFRTFFQDVITFRDKLQSHPRTRISIEEVKTTPKTA